MPDITMCCNALCPKKYECYRYMATPSEWQTFSLLSGEDCKHFWQVENYKYLRTKEAADEQNSKLAANLYKHE